MTSTDHDLAAKYYTAGQPLLTILPKIDYSMPVTHMALIDAGEEMSSEDLDFIERAFEAQREIL